MKTSGSLFNDWTIKVIPVDGTFDVFVHRSNTPFSEADWAFGSHGWADEERAYHKGELWIALKEAQENFRNFN